MASFDPKSLSRADQAVLGGAAVAFIAGFLPWYGYTGPNSILRAYGSVSGWSAGFSAWAGTLLLVLAGVFLLLRRLEVALPSLPVGPAAIVAGVSALGLLLVIIRWLTFPSVPGLAIGSKYGVWIALIAGLAETAGAVVALRESGEPLPWAQASGPGA
ncbi:MAG TPA: hypothetical protein VFA82_03905 [Gaiellaceae bacterium]|nr:hypothetical protein [Gaiellaceae bacterium]